ncbi:hypothetical protein D3C72_1399750 [compost metagenome]
MLNKVNDTLPESHILCFLFLTNVLILISKAGCVIKHALRATPYHFNLIRYRLSNAC